MRKFICSMLLGAIMLTGCQNGSKKTKTPTSPAHNVPPAVYPGANSENPLDASQAYPATQEDISGDVGSPADTYPAPDASAALTPVADSFAPAAGDEKMVRGEAFVEIQESELLTLETYPPQVKLHLKGTLPNPCHELRVNPSQPDEQNRIQVEVYSVAKPDEMCTEVIQDFNALITLGSFPQGHYSVYINGELLAEFDIK